MLATKVICPHCSKHLKTSKPLTVGHRVLCSRCGRSFAVRPDTINDAPAGLPERTGESTLVRPGGRTTPAPPPLPRATPVPAAPPFQTVPDVGLAPPRPSPNRNLLWAGLVVGGLLFFMGATTALALYFASRGEPPVAQLPVHESQPAPADAGERVKDPGPSSERPPLLEPERNPGPSPRPPEVRRPEPPPPLADPPPLLPDPPAEAETTTGLPPEAQEQVNKAIDRGVQFLKKKQVRDGTWGGGRVGMGALPALTLLECGVPKDDIRVQKALRHVRHSLPHLNTTYDLALAILFLDRLGNPEDNKRIQTFALRLVAGQGTTGGWSYPCPILSPEQERDLLTVLQETRPTSPLDLFVQGPNGSAPPGFIARDPRRPPDRKDRHGATVPLDKPSGAPPGGVKPLDKGPRDPEAYRKALGRLPENLRRLPSLQPPEESHNMPRRGDASDNSNTQFAILGLWAAGRHDMPLERPLALVAQRFRASAAGRGGWGYHYAVPTPDPAVTPAMTGAGLLGLAVGHGLVAPEGAGGPADPAPVEDPAIEKGFDVLGQAIGQPLGWKRARARGRSPINLYFLWSLERVGVLYKRRSIGGKDWYPWGAQLLLDNQQDDGSWLCFNYPGTGPITDTCFALLFLKRANLAKDLTKKLEFFIEGKKLRGGQ